MKKIILYAAFFISLQGFSQKLLFTSEYGGDNSNGAIVSYDLSNNSTSTQLSLEGNPFYGINIFREIPFGETDYTAGLTLGTDGKYYGVNTNASGLRSENVLPKRRPKGLFYSYDPITDAYEILHSFVGNQEYNDLVVKSDAFNNDLSNPAYTVLEVNPGIFYGIALSGGVASVGGVWKYNVNTNEYSVVGSYKDPSNDVGYQPITSLIKGDNNNIYGLNLKNSGNNEEGYLYKIDTDTDAITYVGDLLNAGWAIVHPHGQLVYNPSNNTIYGTKDRFTKESSYGGGVWSFDLDTSESASEFGIFQGEIDILGSFVAGIVRANNGKMYATTQAGGAHGKGTIIEFQPSSSSYLKVFDFPSDFPLASGTGMIVSGSKIYGTCSPNNNEAQIWSYDYISQTFDILISGNEADPQKPGYYTDWGILIDNGNIVATSKQASEGGAGSLFSYNISSGQTTILRSHGSREGRNIIGEMTQLNDSIFIGYIGKGGPNTIVGGTPTSSDEQGSIALFNVISGDVQHLDRPSAFQGNNSAQNQWSNRPLLASDDRIYYSAVSYDVAQTQAGFRVHDLNNPGEFLKLYDCPEGYLLGGVIELPSEKIVMTAVNNVYVYDLNTSQITEYNNTHSYQQYGHMKDNIILASNGKIYGMTDASDLGTGADENKAVIYSLDTTNFTFQVEHIFESEVKTTNNGLTEYNGKLYGSTNFLGANNQGHLFSFDMTTKAYTIEHSFDSDQDGGGFSAGWTFYNDKLYSTSRTGGTHGYGTLVEFDLTNSTFNVLEHLTMENGRSYIGTPIFWDDSAIALGIDDLNNDSMINLYPNPANTVLNVNLENVTLIEIFSTTGQLIKRIKNSNTINVEDISSGALIIKVYNDKGIYSSKFIKE